MANPKISELLTNAPATTWNDTDGFELLQGSSKGITKSVMRKNIVSSPTHGGKLEYDEVTDDWILKTPSKWRLISTDRYVEAAPTSTSVLDFTAGDTSDFAVGLPVRFTQSGTTYYAIVTAITANTSVTIAGAPLIAATAITELSVGTPDMVQQVPINILQTSYTSSSGTDLLSTVTGKQYMTWSGPKARLVRFGFTHASATTPVLNVKINGSIVGTSNVTVSATAGVWTYVSPVAIDTALYDINYGEAIEIRCVTHAASSNYLNSLLVFVLE